MVDFLIFCMATVGLTAILVDGKIFAPLREWLEKRARTPKDRRTWAGFLLDILTCYQCCGFWSGLFCGVLLTVSRFINIFEILYLITISSTSGQSDETLHIMFALLFWLMCGLAGSFLATVYLMFVELIYAKTMLCRRTNLDPSHEDGFHEDHEHEQNVD